MIDFKKLTLKFLLTYAAAGVICICASITKILAALGAALAIFLSVFHLVGAEWVYVLFSIAFVIVIANQIIVLRKHRWQKMSINEEAMTNHLWMPRKIAITGAAFITSTLIFGAVVYAILVEQNII